MTDADTRPDPAEAAISARVDELLAAMTLAEKAGQLTQYFSFGLPDATVGTETVEVGEVERALASGGVGSLLFVTDPAEINRLQRLTIEGNRHGIPALFGFDVVHGLRTVLPVPIALAASWDPETIEQGQAVAAREARAVGIHWTFAPMVDIARDPRWGRIVEGAGEDPHLGSAVAAAQVRGFQGAQLGSPERVIAGPKHFAGYGAALGGRDYDEVNLSDSELWNVYFPPFQAALAAGAGNVMTAYMGLNGIPGSGNRWLFTEVLRDRWGFDGFVVSDANAVRNLVTHGFAADLIDAGARGVSAGVDLEMASTEAAYSHLPAAVESGAVSEETIDASVRRVLQAKLRLGLFDQPYVDEDRARTVLADPAHREVTRVAAERSAVLLRNEGALLPLDPGALGSVAVIGPLADSPRDTLGPWIFDFDLDETVTVLEGLRSRLGETAEVRYAPGVRPAQRLFASMFDMFPGNSPTDPEGFDDEAEFQRAVDLARESDVAVMVLGEWQQMIGEAASRSSLELPGRQLELLQAVVATGTPVVLLVMNGRPLDLRWAAEHVPAILDIWYPGSQGGTAVANLLLGDVSPGGKLPFSWPRTVGQVPLIYAHTRSHEPTNQHRRYWDVEGSPLFPFGFGLSYARFDYADLVLDREELSTEESLTASVTVTNPTDRDADEVVQLYLHQRHGSAIRPVRELKGFQRVHLAAGESRTVEFLVGAEERRYWNAGVRDYVLDASPFDVWVGGDSTAQLSATTSWTPRPSTCGSAATRPRSCPRRSPCGDRPALSARTGPAGRRTRAVGEVPGLPPESYFRLSPPVSGDGYVEAVVVIEATELSKRYPRVTALDRLTLSIGNGVTGLVGANGAGKSTLIKILLGLLPATGGRATVFGHDVAADGGVIRALVGYMPEHDCLPADVSANDFVVHMGQMSGLPHSAARERAADVLRHVGLAEERYRPMGGYSTGMKQRAKLAQALVHDPRLVLLDEPTNGLDPQSRDDMLALVRKIGTDFGIAVLVTSHLLGELERVSDQVVVLDAGRLLRSSATTDYLHTTGTLLVEVLGGARETERMARALAGAGLNPRTSGSLIEVEAPEAATYDTVRDLAVDLQLGLVRMQERHHHIEDVFREEEAGSVQPV